LIEWETKLKSTKIHIYEHGCPVHELAYYVQNKVVNWEDGMTLPTQATHKATCRAVHSLKRKGLVQITDVPMGYFERTRSDDHRGGASHCKVVKLSVEFIAKKDCSQHSQEVTA